MYLPFPLALLFRKKKTVKHQKRAPATPVKSKHRQVEVDNDIIIDGKFFGFFSSSQNQRYRIACKDSYGNRGGYREYGNGEVRLYRDNDLITQLHDIERPNEGKVSNMGVFIVEDWLLGDRRESKLYIYDINTQIMVLHFSANMYRSDISDDGLYAIVQTANNETDDGNTMSFIDIRNRKVLWKTVNRIGWAKRHLIDTEKQEILLDQGDFQYRFHFDGSFIDSEKYENERVARANGYELIGIANQILKHGASEKSGEAIQLLHKAIEMDISGNTKARVLRQLGEIALEAGQPADAIGFFEKAVEFNPKVGVKRILSQLKQNQ